jgi:hypothetical protein
VARPLERRVALPRRSTFRFYFVGLFFNNFLPANTGRRRQGVRRQQGGADPHQVIA